MASVLGPAFAGFSISWIGVHWSLCIIFGLVVLSFFIVLQIKKKPILNPKLGEPVLKSLKEGVQFVFKTKAILGALTLDMVAVLFGGAIALLPVFAQDILKVGSEGFGILRASPAVGAFLTMLITAYLPISKNAGLKLLGAIFGFGVCIIIFGLSSIFWISVAALFFSGVTDGVSMVIRQTILQIKTPDHMRGRVASVNSMFVGSSNELGAFESGVTAKLMGTVTAVVFGGAIALLPVFAQDILKVGSEGFGILRASPAVGAFLTMLITAYLPISKNAGLKLLGAIFGFGVCIIIFGLSSIFWVSVVALFFSGVTDGVSMVIRQTILQIKTPDHMRGRVASVNSMFVGSSNELGAFESGLTARLMGTVTAVVFGGTMTLITVVTTGIVSPSFRKLDLRKDIEVHESD